MFFFFFFLLVHRAAGVGESCWRSVCEVPIDERDPPREPPSTASPSPSPGSRPALVATTKLLDDPEITGCPVPRG